MLIDVRNYASALFLWCSLCTDNRSTCFINQAFYKEVPFFKIILGNVYHYHDGGFDGYIRPDHGRQIWDEKAKPGYGLYDRALGAMYIAGIWETLDKMKG